MREYELTVVYDLAVAEAGGADASVQHLTTAIEARGGNVARVDHWGRRRMAYPINRQIDGDYIVSRVNLDPANVRALEAALKIDERVFRHLIVRADELPPPPQPREPRRMPGTEAPAPAAEAAPEAETADEPEVPTADATPDVTEVPATVAEAEEPGEAEASPPVAEAGDAPPEGSAEPSGTIAEPSA
ncbi:MAG: 30S ribosomal protein S6 [Chloroflexi bacterium]|nr:30S ribosomal protein S6 [Chloroflexota bacterium]